jgi:hypothetical protein
MMPPECEICGLAFDPKKGGGTVGFADLEELPQGMSGHPAGLGWFCAGHLEAARALRQLDLAEACRRLRGGD